MELKRYEYFSPLNPIEDRIDEVINLFPDLDSIIDICQALDGFQLNHITPSLYKSSALIWKNWCGGLIIDDVHYFNLSKNDRSQLKDIFLQELIYSNRDYDEWYIQKWRSSSFKLFKIIDDKIKVEDNLAPCYRVNLKIINTKINEYNFNHDEDFKSEVIEMKNYFKSRDLNFILLNKIKDSKIEIIVISSKYFENE